MILTKITYARIASLMFFLTCIQIGSRAQNLSASESRVPAVSKSTGSGNSVLLDRVVAVINGDVILKSDVLEEIRFVQLQPFQVKELGNSSQQALSHIIDRTLILQQLAELQTVPHVAEADVSTQIEDLRKHLPLCGGNKCETKAGWQQVLASHGFTEDQFRQRWRVRMLVLGFIEQRFRPGVRISKPEIKDYYDKSFVPEFSKRKLPAPPLAQVSQRIDELLLQQHVNGLLAEWLDSLKDQGSVAILDPAYQQLAPRLAAQATTDSDDEEVQQ